MTRHVHGEAGNEPAWTGLLLATLIGGPARSVFQRYGLHPLVTGLLTNFLIKAYSAGCGRRASRPLKMPPVGKTSQ